MKTLLLIPLLTALVACAPTDPVPFKVGKDGCDHCKMTIMSNLYGMELITEKGKIYKFDDISCAVSFYKKQTDAGIRIFVADHESGNLISAETANYVKSDQNRTPMNSMVVAFASEEKAKAFQKKKGGDIFTWNSVKDMF